MAAYVPDPTDSQKIAVYTAQTQVMKAHPEYDLDDLDSTRKYVREVLQAESAGAVPCYKGWLHTGGGAELIVDRSALDQELAGETASHPVTGHSIVLLRWKDRYSHYDYDKREIILGSPSGRPLSHRLLAVHEVVHGTVPETAKHGPEWVGAFIGMTRRRLPELVDELVTAFDDAGVAYAPIA